MKPQTKPFLIEIKAPRRGKRSHAKPSWPTITRAGLADQESTNTSDDADQKLKKSGERV